MFGFAREKVKGGKLLYVRVNYDEESITDIQILGDFFAHPEEGIKDIEGSLSGVRLEHMDITNAINETISSGSIELVGVDPDSIAKAILKAAER